MLQPPSFGDIYMQKILNAVCQFSSVFVRLQTYQVKLWMDKNVFLNGLYRIHLVRLLPDRHH